MITIPVFELSGGAIAGIVIASFVAGVVLGYFLARWLFKREMKKNPPINEKMIRAMFSQMGRKPSEAQVRSVMRAMNDANTK
jgi:uncharacterized protein